MSDSTDADALPEELADRLYEIHFDEDPASRSKLLEDLCAEYAQHARALRQRARVLVRGDDLFGRVRKKLEEPCMADRFGRFEVRSVLGEGGFGTVYLAEQLDPVRRSVALKVLQPGRVGARALQRFESERQVLARLQHACIAQIYDAGATAEGHHYFAMELVSGKPVTTWCDEAELDIEARLRLFLRICGAIQHAHQRGVVHRDIKPSNVLVHEEDGQPSPKVIDFGVAKLLTAEDSVASDGPLLTRDGAQVGTPGYMSPEQAAGEPIDTRSDVYALGVLLCELMTGKLPFARERLTGSIAAMARMLSDEEPRRPRQILGLDPAAADLAARQRRTTASSLLRVLRADLEWVLLKALARQPDDRYASVAALADDIERYLRNEPVSVRERVASYWLRKFIVRHRIAVAVAGGICLSVLAGIVGLIWTLNVVEQARLDEVESSRQAKAQRDAAQSNAYAANMSAAQLAMESGDVATAVRQLAATDPDRRGWEWRHLATRSDDALMAIELDAEILDLAWIDSRRFLGFESEGEIGIWSVADGSRERTLPEWDGVFRAFALDRERGRVAIGNDARVGLWDYQEGRYLGQLLAVDNPVLALAWSLDRRMLAVASRGGCLDVVQMGTEVAESAVRRLPELKADAFSLAFLGDGELLVGLDNGVIQHMDPQSGELGAVLEGHTDEVDDLLPHPDGNLLFSASLDTTVRVWDLSTGQMRVALPGQLRMRRLALSPDGGTLYASGGWSDNRVIAWSTTTFQVLGRYHGHRNGVTGMAVDPTGTHLLTSARDLILRLWSGTPPESRVRLDAGRDARNLVIDTNAERFAAASMDGVVTVWNATTLQQELKLETDEAWAGCALGVDRVYAAGPVLAAFRLDTGERTAEGATRGLYIEKMTMDPQQRWLIGGHDQRTLVWQLPSLELRHVLELPAGTGRVIHDPRTDTFILGCNDSTLRWLDPERGVVVDELRLEERDRLVGGLALHADLLVAGLHQDYAAPLRNTETRLGVLSWRRANDALRRIPTSAIGASVSPDGTRLATAGADHALRLWDTATMQEMLVLDDLVYGLVDVHFVAGGNRIIALSHRWKSPTYIYVWAAPPQASLPR